MNHVKQSFAWWCFENRGVEPTALLREAKKIGFMGVEYLPTEFWNEAENIGLNIVNIPGHSPLERGFNHLENHGFIETELFQQLKLASRFNIPYLTVF
jgi:hydroxypyruvate isomerase